MQNSFLGFYPQKIINNEDFYKECKIVLDVESLLYFYRVNEKCSNTMIKVLENLQNRLWLPYDIAWLYHQRMNDEIINQSNNINSSLACLVNCKSFIDSYDKYPYVDDELSNKLKQFIYEFDEQCKREISKLRKILKGEGIKEKICNLYKNKIGDKYDDADLKSIYAEGKRRYSSKIPPGYININSNERIMYHDFIVWKQLQAYFGNSEENVLYVTGHIRNDYYYIVNKKIVSPRNELIDEFRNITKSTFNCIGIYDFFLKFKDVLTDENKEIKYLLEVLEKIQENTKNDSNVISNVNNFTNTDNVIDSQMTAHE